MYRGLAEGLESMTRMVVILLVVSALLVIGAGALIHRCSTDATEIRSLRQQLVAAQQERSRVARQNSDLLHDNHRLEAMVLDCNERQMNCEADLNWARSPERAIEQCMRIEVTRYGSSRVARDEYQRLLREERTRSH